MKLSKEQKRVLQLSSKLFPLDEEIENNWERCIDHEWDAHHCDIITFSEAVEEYQVLRSFDIEIQPTPYPEYKLNKKIQKKFERNGQDYEWLIEEYFDGDPECAFYDHECKEVMQRWINTNTGQITVLGKVYMNDPKRFSFNTYSKFRVVNGKHKGKSTKIFWNNFRRYYGNGFYADLSVHPTLEKYGYQPIDALDWSLYVGSELETNQPTTSKYFASIANKQGWDNYLVTTLKGQSPYEKEIKLMGIDTFFKYFDLEDEIKPQYLAAYKIAARHKYEQRNDDLWHDLVLYLIRLNRDVHNPFYVCPDDLAQAHHQCHMQVMRKEDKLKYEQELAKAIEENEAYIKVCKRFLDIVLQAKNLTIRPLRSVEEFVQEGQIMHNCVYHMGYYKKPQTLILSAQDNQKKHVATIRMNTTNWEIVELRGPFNQDCDRANEIKQLIKSNIKLFKKAAIAA